jgi:hypothetical protein
LTHVFVILQLKDEQYELRTLVTDMSEQLLQLTAQLPKPKTVKPKKLTKKAQAELDAAMQTALTTALSPTTRTTAAAPAAASKPASSSTATTTSTANTTATKPRHVGPGRPKKDVTTTAVKKPLAKKISEVPMNTPMRNALQLSEQVPLKAPVRRRNSAETHASIMQRRKLLSAASTDDSSIAQASSNTTSASTAVNREAAAATDATNDSSSDTAEVALPVTLAADLDTAVGRAQSGEALADDAAESTSTV